MEAGYQAQMGEDGRVRLGGTLSSEHLELLKKNSPTADEILEHVEELSEEVKDAALLSGATILEEEGPQETVAAKRLPVVVLPTPSSKRGAIVKKFNPSDRISPEGEKMNLKQDVADIDAAVDPDSGSQPVEAGGDMRSQILELLRNTPGAPTEAEIAKMKVEKGENAVHVIAFGEGDVYIYTHLNRGTWKQVNETMLKIQGAGNEPNLEDKLKEKVIQYCVLWPRLPLEFFYKSRAGVIDSLYQVIMLNSYFLTPQQALMLTTSL